LCPSPLARLWEAVAIEAWKSNLMTTSPAKLLEQKQQLVERLHEDSGPEEREHIEQLLAKINKAMDLLDGAGVSGSD
jgi:hypothetical protein